METTNDDRARNALTNIVDIAQKQIENLLQLSEKLTGAMLSASVSRQVIADRCEKTAKLIGEIMIEKLEQLKKLGTYAINIFYGEDIGCDDSGVKIEDRKIRIIAAPVGYLGEVRILYEGKYSDFLKFDFSGSFEIISNPPKKEEYSRENTLFVWGTDFCIEEIKTANKIFKC